MDSEFELGATRTLQLRRLTKTWVSTEVRVGACWFNMRFKPKKWVSFKVRTLDDIHLMAFPKYSKHLPVLRNKENRCNTCVSDSTGFDGEDDVVFFFGF